MYADHAEIDYTVDAAHVTQLEISVRVNDSSTLSITVPDGFYFSGTLHSKQRVDATPSWNLRNLVIAPTADFGVLVNRCTNEWVAAPLHTPSMPPYLFSRQVDAFDESLDRDVISLCVTPNGTMLTTGGMDGTLAELTLFGEPIRLFILPFPTCAIACSYTHVAVSTNTTAERVRRITILKLQTLEVETAWGNYGVCQGHLDDVSALRFSPDGAFVFVSSSQHWISMFTVDGVFVRALGNGFTFYSDIEVVDNGRSVVGLDNEDRSRLVIMSTRTGSVTGTLECNEATYLTSLGQGGGFLFAFDTTLATIFVYK